MRMPFDHTGICIIMMIITMVIIYMVCALQDTIKHEILFFEMGMACLHDAIVIAFKAELKSRMHVRVVKLSDFDGKECDNWSFHPPSSSAASKVPVRPGVH
jgi:hypothetical protein